MRRATAHRVLIALAIVLVIAGSFAAQSAETQLAGGIAPATHRGIPPHTCTPTFCVIHPSSHVVGGWRYPVLPALLLLAGMLVFVAAIWPGRERRRSATDAARDRRSPPQATTSH